MLNKQCPECESIWWWRHARGLMHELERDLCPACLSEWKRKKTRNTYYLPWCEPVTLATPVQGEML
jgi:hypothetical protein